MIFLWSCILWLSVLSPGVPNFQSWKKARDTSYQAVFSKDGRVIQERRIDFKKNHRGLIEFRNIPEEFIRDVTTSEDHRFFHHYGVDPVALISGAMKTFRGGARGASTVTMQLAGILYPQIKKSHPLLYKLQQGLLAMKIESAWSKEQILEAYLNTVSFGGESIGLMSASLNYFGKSPDFLNTEERLYLVGSLPSPMASVKQKQQRACQLGRRRYSNYDCSKMATPGVFGVGLAQLAPHVIQEFAKKNQIHTTIDYNLQRFSQDKLEEHLKALEGRNARDGAIIVADISSGEVLAYVGGSHHGSSSVNHVRAKRQVGSTLKPFLYALGIQDRYITMTTPLMDSPFSVSVDGLSYQPGNYNRGYLMKAIPAKEALGSSLNIPAVRLIDLLTPERFYEWMIGFGTKLPESPDFYGHSLALGAVDLSLWDLVSAYSFLATPSPYPLHLEHTDDQSALVNPLKPETAFIIQKILSEKNNRIHSFGIDSVLATPAWSAVKTGTSKDMRDNWCIGFTSKYIVGVWLGNSSGEAMWNVTGISGAGPIYGELITYLHEKSPSVAPVKPNGVFQDKDDYYLSGTEPLVDQSMAVQNDVLEITSPTKNGIYAWDPGIPNPSQKLSLIARGIKNPVWKLNGNTLPSGVDHLSLHSDMRGKQLIELLDADRVIDQAEFIVKSARRKRGSTVSASPKI